MKIIIIVILITFSVVNVSFPTVLFEDNFDDSTDWQSNQTVSKATGGEDIVVTDDPSDGCTGQCPPEGWFGYYASASAWADRGDDTYILSSEGAYGGSGKGMTMNVECFDNWAGGRLFIWLGEAGYEEIYVRMRVKYHATWEWNDGTGNTIQKWMRISSFWGDALDNPSQPWNQYQVAGINETVFYPDMYYNGSFSSLSFQSTCYGSPNYNIVEQAVYPSYPRIDDGSWHVIEYRVKMNSTPGTGDGEYELWVDGVQFTVKSTIMWREAGSSTAWGWNAVLPLDNIVMPFDTVLEKEQKLYMDDIVVSTAYIGTSYVIGGVVAPTIGMNQTGVSKR